MTKRKHRFFNTYLTATFSVALVLFLVGLECVIGLSASGLLKQVKESTTLTLVLSDEATASDSLRVATLLNVAPFCHSFEYISKEQALADHIEQLGEDPTVLLGGYNPIRAAFEMKVASDYVQSDSLAKVETILSAYDFVEQVEYSHAVVEFFSSNVGKIVWALLGIAIVLLTISVVLIVNTIRLTVYSRRFIIHTMKLVGATPWMIKGPIVRRSMLMGLWAGLLAIAMTIGVVYYCFVKFGFWLFPLTALNVALVVLIVVFNGLLITFFSSVFAVNKYIRMKADDLYYV